MSPSLVLGLELRWFLVLLAALLGYRMLTRGIVLSGLFADKATGQPVSAERVQLFIATLALSVHYVTEVAQGSGTTMPEVSAQWLTIFGASSGVYAAIKAAKTLNISKT